MSTQRINNEIEGQYGENLDKRKILPPVVKMNLL
jgi:hypothetical protein